MILDNSSLKKQANKADHSVSEQLALLLEKDQIIDDQATIIERKSDVISEQKKRIQILEEALRLTKVKRFSTSSEQSTQTSLFDEAEAEATIDFDQAKGADDEAGEIAVEEESRETSPAETKKKTRRKPFASDLPREQVFAYLSEQEKSGAIDTFFTKVREELDIMPAQVRVLEYMQEKAVFIELHDDVKQRTIKSAEMPKHPVARAMGSINLMSFVIISKYADGLPLYRQEKILSRYGGELSRTTLANWVIASAKQLQPLINLLREHQHAGDVIMADETRIQVLKEPDQTKGQTKLRVKTKLRV